MEVRDALRWGPALRKRKKYENGFGGGRERERARKRMGRTSRAGWSDAMAAKWLSHRKRFMSSVCSMPALWSIASVHSAAHHGTKEEKERAVCSQSLGLAPQDFALLLGGAMEALYEADTEDEDVRRAEGHALRLGGGEDVLEGDGVRRDGIIGQLAVEVRVVLHEVDEDTTAADAVLGPVYAGEVGERACSSEKCMEE